MHDQSSPYLPKSPGVRSRSRLACDSGVGPRLCPMMIRPDPGLLSGFRKARMREYLSGNGDRIVVQSIAIDKRGRDSEKRSGKFAVDRVFECASISIGDCTTILRSVSAYYHTVKRDSLVGALFTIAWFLFAYHIYDDRANYRGSAGCFIALGVTLLLTESSCESIRKCHLVAAARPFLILAYFAPAFGHLSPDFWLEAMVLLCFGFA